VIETFGDKPAFPQPAPKTGSGLHSHDENGKAGNEHHHRGEGSEIAKKIGHFVSPFPLCFYFVLYLFTRQALAVDKMRLRRRW
jgi:hypothetical protein